MQPNLCPFCKNPVQPNFIFCPTCGKNLIESTLPISLSKQLGVYALSLLIPPLGLVPGIKYLVSKSPNGKQVGLIAITLTVVAILIGLIVVRQFIEQVNESVNLELNQYENLGI